jgi:hypothetical protein
VLRKPQFAFVGGEQTISRTNRRISGRSFEHDVAFDERKLALGRLQPSTSGVFT